MKKYLIFLQGMSIFGALQAASQPQKIAIKQEQNMQRSTMVSIGISLEQRETVVAELKKILANEFVLYLKTLKMHWNIEGKHFGALHELFKQEYEQLLEITDDVAERIRQLGFPAPATMHEYLKMATLTEDPGVYPDDLGMIKILLDGHEHVIKQIRPVADLAMENNDTGSNNMLADMLQKHEKTAWMLRAHLAK